jgi:peptide chain release factor subunit 1
MANKSLKRYRVRKLIAFLSEKEARGMEFVSLYIPRAMSIDEIVLMLKEKSNALDIKSEDVRDRAQGAYKNAIQLLEQHKEIPENGLAIFAGTFATDGPESEVVNIEEIIPPEPITAYLCEIDDHFDLEPLREMLRNESVVGLLSVDSKEAGFGILNGNRFDMIENITSGIPGKSGKGGSSQRRYERGRDMELTYYFHRVGEHATKAFLENHKVTALIVGGPGLTKESFLKGDYLRYELKNRLLVSVDTLYSGKDGVREVLEKSSDVLKNAQAVDEKIVVRRLLADIGKRDGLAIRGLDSVLNALKNGTAEVALVTDDTDMIEIAAICKKCELSKAKIVDKEKKVQTVQDMISSPCEKCNAVDYEVGERDMVDILEDAASQTDADVEVISESDEKIKLKDLGGIAAILRYNAA